MDPIVSTWLELIVRWAHVLAGVVWIGFLVFFTTVQLQAFASMGDARVPAARELMPRGLWWFRWMAALTALSGIILLWLVYYEGGMLYDADPEAEAAGTIVALAGTVIALIAYDWMMSRVESDFRAHLLSVILLAGLYWLYQGVAGFNGRAVWIHAGSAMGLALLMNVWVRVWPAARDHVIPALNRGEMPAPASMKIIATRARRSIYVAVPLLFLMISNHYPILWSSRAHALYFAIVIAAGALVAMAFLRRASRLQSVRPADE